MVEVGDLTHPLLHHLMVVQVVEDFISIMVEMVLRVHKPMVNLCLLLKDIKEVIPEVEIQESKVEEEELEVQVKMV